MYQSTARIYDLIYELSGKDYGAESAAIAALIEERHTAARSVLDVACGTGGHLVHLQRHFEVAGLDLSADMLAVARERLPNMDLRQGDMRSFDLARPFDAIVCLFSSIGYLPDAEALKEAIDCMSRHLAPAGVLVIDGWVRPGAWEDGHVHTISGTRDGVAVARVGRSERDGMTTILELHHLVATSAAAEHLVERHELTLFTDDEYKQAFALAGLTVETVESPIQDRDRYVGTKPA